MERKEFTEELRKKAEEAKSAEELLKLAKENEIELTEESAKAYFEQLHKTGELEDDELENVSGGGCHTSDGRLITTVYNCCSHFVCRRCGEDLSYRDFHYCRGGAYKDYCESCEYCTYEDALWLCNHPANRS